MQDPPNGEYLLGLVAAFLRNEVLPHVTGSLAYQVRVAANAVDLARRELDLAPDEQAAERERLERLLGQTGSLPDLNAELCQRIRDRKVDLSMPGFADHLRRATLAKLAVDQPKYSAYLRARDAWDNIYTGPPPESE